MRNAKKWMAFGLAAALGLGGCNSSSQEPTKQPEEISEAPVTEAEKKTSIQQVSDDSGEKTYTAQAEGFGGPVTVWVTVKDNVITDVTAAGLDETPGKGSVVIDELPGKIVEAGSTTVDGISGATITSDALKRAVDAALENKIQGQAPSAVETVFYKEGAYTGRGFGFHSYVTVETVFTKDAIKSVTVIDNSGETPYLRDLCAEKIPAAIVEGQSLNVDAVTGATWGSEAIINGVADCVAQAAGEDAVSFLKQIKKAPPEAVNQVFENYDVCVIGGGGSGLIAASVAAKEGLKVIVLEAADRFGGVSEIAGGAALAIGTEIQKQAVQEDGTIKDLYEEAGETADEVTGVEAVNETGGITTVHAKAVILATGGFSNNTEMMKEYLDDYNEYYMNWGGSTSNGDGVRMAWEIGAEKGRVGSQSHNEGLPLELHGLLDMDITTGNCLYANLAYEPMLRLNRRTGRRISDETVIYTPHYHGNVSMMSEGAMVILDQAAMDSLMENGSQTRPWRSRMYGEPMKNPDYTGLNLQEQTDAVVDAGFAYKADTLEELAVLMGVDADVLPEEVEKYNQAVKTGQDAEYDRDPSTLVYTIEKGPFYALETRVRNLGTYGGLVTDETLAIYHEDGHIIPGLYAAGFDALGWSGSSYFVDTTTLGWMTASGYMAGHSVVNYITHK